MHVVLASMPWSSHYRPSAAIGALGAYLKREEPELRVTTRYDYISLAEPLGFNLYETVAIHCYSIGEPLYMLELYPERTAEVREHFRAWAASEPNFTPESAMVAMREDGMFERIRAAIARHLRSVAKDIVRERVELLGLTTCFGQLFANLALAREVKAAAPETTIILGGSTLSSRVGASVLAEYPFVDAVIQGEGELPLRAAARSLRNQGELGECDGLLTRSLVARGRTEAKLWEVERLDDLPAPDYDAFATVADDLGIEWEIPLEGSRGCWWDRTKRAGDPKATCYFCNLNVQWNGYREKSIERVAEELRELSDRHRSTQIYYLDNIIRHRGVVDLARAIVGLGKDFNIFHEMRVSTRPIEILSMWEAGLRRALFGIEGFSNSFLRRIGKGTRVIQNLEAMKTCRELGIRCISFLITDFPGTTNEEIHETRRNILEYGIAYEACQLSPFTLGVGATLDVLRDEFGITNVRNERGSRAGLPEDVEGRLALTDLDFETADPQISWQPVREAQREWARRSGERSDPLLVYWDGGKFMRVLDRRDGDRILTLEGRHREVLLSCMEIQGRSQLLERHAHYGADLVSRTLLELGEARLLFEDDGKYLALPVASSPAAAAKRIHAFNADKAERKRPLLPILDAAQAHAVGSSRE